MNITLKSTKKIILPALIGAGLTYAAINLSSDEAFQQQQIALLETRVQGLEALLAQKEEQLKNVRTFSVGGSKQRNLAAADKPTQQNIPQANIEQPEKLTPEAEGTAISTESSDQILKDLMTQFIGDQRSFSEKVNDFLASDPSRENVAIASTGIFNLADNREILPDQALHSLYRDQTDPDIKRVTAQVASLRGDNSLMDLQIAESRSSLESDNPAERQKALVELGKTRYAGAANAIAPLLQDEDIGVKLDALLALRATGNQRHIRLVEELANDPNESVSWLANDVISKLQNLSDVARTKLASSDIVEELPVIVAR